MPFIIKFFPKGHQGVEKPHYMLYNINKKQLGKRHFNTKQAAINSGKQAIAYREKKKAKVVNKNNKTYIVPIDYKI